MLWSFNSSANSSPTQNTPPLEATIFRIEMKDPSRTQLGEHGLIDVIIQGNVQAGPSNTLINTVGMPQKYEANTPGAYTYALNENPDAFDAQNAFANVARTHLYYQRVLNQLGVNHPFNWQWGTDAISLHPHAGTLENAYYSRQERCLKFFKFQSQTHPAQTIYTCRAQDIVAHETGHAVLDTLRPGYLESYAPQTGALHEAFGDLSSIFVLLDQANSAQEVMLKSLGNLREKGLFLPDLANQFGNAIGQHNGLRNADNQLTINQVGQEVHALSQVFSGAIYNILARTFTYNEAKLNYLENPTKVLQDTSNELSCLLIQAIINGPQNNATFADIANNMIYYAKDAKVREFIRSEFESRGVNLSMRVTDIPAEEICRANYNLCSNTLRRPEAAQLRQQAVDQRINEIEADKNSYLPRALRLG